MMEQLSRGVVGRIRIDGQGDDDMKAWIFIVLTMFFSCLYAEVGVGGEVEVFTVKSDSVGESIYKQVKKLLGKLETVLRKERLFRQSEFNDLERRIKSNNIKSAVGMLEDYRLRGGKKVRKVLKRLRRRLDALTSGEESLQTALSEGKNCSNSGFEEVEFFSTERAFAALKPSGLVITWGDILHGGDSGDVADEISCGVVDIVATKSAFAALKADGSVVTWGNADAGGDSSSVSNELNNVSKIYASTRAFVAVRKDGSAVVWGDRLYGGEAAVITGERVFPLHPSLLDGSKGRIVKISSTESAFAAMVEDKEDPSDKFVVVWGEGLYGGDFVVHRNNYSCSACSGVSYYVAPLLESGVVDIFATRWAFAALKEDGSVVSWGMDRFDGGDWYTVASDLQSGVAKIFSNGYAFAALKDDGSVVPWGADGRNYMSVDAAALLSGGVVDIVVSSNYGFVAVKSDGSIVIWGRDAGYNRHTPASGMPLNFVTLVGASIGFAAIEQDGSVVSWGTYFINDKWGTEYFLHPAKEIFSNDYAFAALMENGAVFAWGDNDNGGYSDSDYMAFLDAQQKEYEDLSEQFYESTGKYPDRAEDVDRLNEEAMKRSVHHLYMVQSGAVKIAATKAAFVALKGDGSIVTWGAVGYGADSGSVSSLFGTSN